ncbi:hypothetical protein ACYULU_16145 [Breznakiellaceae bacterium SP9]
MPTKGRYYIPRHSRIHRGFLRFDGFHRLFVPAYGSSSMKKLLPLFAALCLLCASCAGTPAANKTETNGTESTMSLDQALSAAAVAVEKKLEHGTEIMLTAIDASTPELSDFLNHGLSARFVSNGKLTLIARKQALENVDDEHNFQMSGMVDDESAVGIGHYLGAKVAISGSFKRFGNFSRLQIQAVDEKTSEIIVEYSARISNDDPVLADLQFVVVPYA